MDTSIITAAIINGKAVAGLKETTRLCAEGRVRAVVVAEDSDPHIHKIVDELISKHGLSAIKVPSKLELGKQLSLKVACAVMAILN